MKDIYLPVGKTTAFDCEVIKTASDIADGSVIVKIKPKREDCLPQTLRVEWQNPYECYKHWTRRIVHLQRSNH